MAVHLREYQSDIIDRARREMTLHKRVLIQAPTGAGKTVLASFMLNSAAGKGKRCWFIVHRQELVEQTALTFDKCGIPYGIIAAGFPQNPFAKIQICSIGTVKNRLARVAAPDLIVWDECHHLGAAGWQAVLDYFPNAWHVGLSATPIRLDGKGLGRWFQSMVRGPAVRWLIDNGHLSDYRLFAPSTPNLDGVHTRGGDYVAAELDEIMRGRAIVGDIVRHWKKNAAGKLTIGFAPSIKASEEYVAAFRAAGVMAVHLDGKMERHDRKLAGKAFAAGDIQVLWNVDLFGEGFDLAALAGRDVTVEAVIQARPTQSLGLHLQQIGRALRKKASPAIILDHAGNALRMIERHGSGLPDDEFDWTLDDRAKKKGGDGEVAFATRQCGRCYRVHRPAPICPGCGFVYPIQHREVEEVEADLQEVDVAAQRRQRLAEQGQARSLDDLIALGKRRGYPHAEKWAARVMTARMAGRHADA